MIKIKKLLPNEARKIAAGEVVERPANVLKELIENSIDANADQITVFIEVAGKKLIRVIDNGCGMSNEDAELCFEHHATSKINSIDDLQSLSTFGFRGEALSSISAVSKVKLITKEKNSLEGIYINIEDGQFKIKEPIACSTGTDIEISDIFYNVPARLKFLKKDESELRQIVQLFQVFCLSNVNIHFKLFHDNKLMYNCPSVHNLRSRTMQLWDHNFEQNMCDFEGNEINIKSHGLISNHHVTRFNRSQIFFFVNGRWIKNNGLVKGLIKGYSNILPRDKFPIAFIFIEINQDLIDINVHPRKEEVQFIHPKKVEDLIKSTAMHCLETQLTKKIENTIQSNEYLNIDKNKQSKFLAATQTTFDFEQIPFFEPYDQLNTKEFVQFYDTKPSSSDLFVQEHKDIPLKNLNVNEKKEHKNYKIIGQFKNCYILLEKEDGMLIIDQHAAHERILYEIFSKKFDEIPTIKLIFPIIVNLSVEHLSIISNYFEFLKNYGIDVECFSKDQLIITSIPAYLKNLKFDDIFNELVSLVEEYQDLDKSEFFKLMNEKLCAQLACKTAIKAGDRLEIDQIRQLLDDLQSTENRFACPHGRPVSWDLSLNEIEKKFKRNYKG